jgi:hypothetical protein
MVSAERVANILGTLGIADVDNFVACEPEALRRHLGRNPTATLGEEEALIAARTHFAQAVGAAGMRNEVAGDRHDEAAEIVAELEAAGLSVDRYRDVADGLLDR